MHHRTDQTRTRAARDRSRQMRDARTLKRQGQAQLGVTR